ncbi:MAG: hypothetical protein BWY09_02701 [Candidatus Hydrogenedentes bacterium ADurb.Bin179]|nr:MAG: hypothetical protein BWY09_02701 [Candidatus Hydrogenedentes bacterium ADurb.Bin179]
MAGGRHGAGASFRHGMGRKSAFAGKSIYAQAGIEKPAIAIYCHEKGLSGAFVGSFWGFGCANEKPRKMGILAIFHRVLSGGGSRGRTGDLRLMSPEL